MGSRDRVTRHPASPSATRSFATDGDQDRDDDTLSA